MPILIVVDSIGSSSSSRPSQATVFPKGAIHFQQNIGCKPAKFVAAFNHEDPGVLTIANSFFGQFPDDIVQASLGGELSAEEFEQLKSAIPANVALGVEECLIRCGLKKKPEPKKYDADDAEYRK
ncbi:unnamed protein product [Didymodactylos carnosus]|uniref:Cupin type-1 domain-containing protein n=2 Tax=Didymodactylos carnosus TaxID=1234261 RepID=A0A8S2IWH3_9BILA|nr:unnamed protein product [Didymodactylos carnosus]CAF3779184.1 unnamed protein product [Didymodactylos carnosus]